MTKKAVLIVLPLLLLAEVAVLLFCYDQEGFAGNRIKNLNAYLLDIETMNGTDLHTLELREGDALQIQFETEKGTLYMEIKAPDGTTICRGNGKETTNFSVNIVESGIYTVVLMLPLRSSDLSYLPPLREPPNPPSQPSAPLCYPHFLVMTRELRYSPGVTCSK